MKQGWRHVRAAFILFHLTAIFIAGMPSTESALKRSAWKDPTVQAEFAAWSARLGVPQPELEDQLFVFAQAWAKGRGSLERPFRPYLNLSATDQSWQMFVAPHMFPTRFEIAVTRNGRDWQTVFKERSATETWRADLFGVERLRASIFRWGWAAYAGAYHKACKALATDLFAEEPTVRAVRCRFWKARSPSPADAAAGIEEKGTFVYPYEVSR